ncbi:hypothetical protein ACFQ60_01550 [Streptomyces zhihengii]
MAEAHNCPTAVSVGASRHSVRVPSRAVAWCERAFAARVAFDEATHHTTLGMRCATWPLFRIDEFDVAARTGFTLAAQGRVTALTVLSGEVECTVGSERATAARVTHCCCAGPACRPRDGPVRPSPPARSHWPGLVRTTSPRTGTRRPDPRHVATPRHADLWEGAVRQAMGVFDAGGIVASTALHMLQVTLLAAPRTRRCSGRCHPPCGGRPAS